MTDPPRSLLRAAVVDTTGGAHVLRAVGDEVFGIAARVEPLDMQPNAVQSAEIGALVASGALRVELARTLALSGREKHMSSASRATRAARSF